MSLKLFSAIFLLALFVLHAAALDDWTYIQVDGARANQAFGLAMGDLTGDGFGDIASGRYFYRNPGGNMAGQWNRVNLPGSGDAILVVDVDGDNLGDIIAQKLPDVLWLEATDAQGTAWTSRVIGTVPKTSHGNAQGYALGQIVAGGKPEILISSGDGIHFFEIPSNPTAGPWPKIKITSGTTEEGIGVGDIDGDGQVDVGAGMESSGAITWWKNPGNGKGTWTKFEIGSAKNPDRMVAADINGDKKLDLVVTEEVIVAEKASRVYWFEQPADPKNSSWQRHEIALRYPAFSLDAADMDGDGDIDVVTGENAIGANDNKEETIVWENTGKGSSWTPHVVATGKEAHLGARVADLDNDGDLEIASICWTTYQYLHLWRNNANPPVSIQNHPVSPRLNTGWAFTEGRLKLFDVSGRTVFSGPSQNLRFFPLPRGVYAARVTAQGKTHFRLFHKRD